MISAHKAREITIKNREKYVNTHIDRIDSAIVEIASRGENVCVYIVEQELHLSIIDNIPCEYEVTSEKNILTIRW